MHSTLRPGVVEENVGFFFAIRDIKNLRFWRCSLKPLSPWTTVVQSNVPSNSSTPIETKQNVQSVVKMAENPESLNTREFSYDTLA
jgi:hypothetical protein